MGAALFTQAKGPPAPPPRALLLKRHALFKSGALGGGAGTAQGTGTAFTRWSENLYCSGAQAQRCQLTDGRDVLPGMCHWHKQYAQHRWEPVEEADMNTTKRLTFTRHRWDPLQPRKPQSDESGKSGKSGESGFRYFGRDAARRCLQGKRVLVAGDSTTRDTFYELVTVPPTQPLCRRWPVAHSSVAQHTLLLAGGRAWRQAHAQPAKHEPGVLA